ncbi:sulfite exporter TauE/SafE family protein [Nakamurella sp.]|uniref:sulfite exporter TauE/SafE family protein n=1 Tax=Nakamurella sp. TaxID=1869182 RepID=UPI003783519A
MSWWEALAVFAAGIGAGTINVVVGSGTLITFPVLLSVGLSPLTANVTNTLGLVPGSFTGAWGYRRELTGQRRSLIILGSASVIGAIAGALLLLVLPPAAFKAIVPVLIALALVLVLAGPAINRRVAARGKMRDPEQPGPGLWAGILGCGVYGGYFGAAQGVLMMGLMGALRGPDMQRNNAMKNMLTGLVNGVAAVVFIVVAEPAWPYVALVAAGSTVGGFIGAKVGRKLPPPVLRGVIVVVGLIAIAKLVTS